MRSTKRAGMNTGRTRLARIWVSLTVLLASVLLIVSGCMNQSEEAEWENPLTDEDLAFMNAATHTPQGSEDGDNDGLTNSQEGAVFAVLNPGPPVPAYTSTSCPFINKGDSDSDGVNDSEEINSAGATDKTYTAVAVNAGVVLGTYGDSNPCLADADSDGLNDSQEALALTNPNEADTDDDGSNDGAEVIAGTNPLVNEKTVDGDSDGLSDHAEGLLGTLKANPDSDGDGLSDGIEVGCTFVSGTPCTGTATTYEKVTDTGATTTKTGDTNPLNPDTDGDGLKDGDELNKTPATNTPAGTDTAFQAVTKPATHYGRNASGVSTVPAMDSNPNAKDTDGDGLSDNEEVNSHKTSPQDVDSDGDNTNDGPEVQGGTDPLVNSASNDADSDGLSDASEALLGTDKNIKDTDNDGLEDGKEVGCTFVLNTPCSGAAATYTAVVDAGAATPTVGDTNPVKSDTDGDGILDGAELVVGTAGSFDVVTQPATFYSTTSLPPAMDTNPNAKDTDGDGLADNVEISGQKTSPQHSDSDGDTLTDGNEVNPGSGFTSSPLLQDTDGGGLPDGHATLPNEKTNGHNPNDPFDD